VNGPELERRVTSIEEKLNTLLEYFHIGQPPKELSDIESMADAVVRRVNFKHKKNTPGRGLNPPAGSSFVKGPRLIKKEGRE
jgi:hypothetical protein